MPLTKLVDFVESLGPAPGEDALRTYLNRLKESGFSVANLLSKFHQCGIGASLVVTILGLSRWLWSLLWHFK